MDSSPEWNKVWKERQNTIFGGFAVGPTKQKQEDSVRVVPWHIRPVVVWSTWNAGRNCLQSTEDLEGNEVDEKKVHMF